MGVLAELRIVDVLDVVLVAVLLWVAIVGLRRSGATLALLGFALLGAIYVVAQRFEMALTARLLQAFFAVFVIVLVVVFQDDLRRLVERIAVWGLGRRAPGTPASALDTLVRSVTRLISGRHGALLVVPGREPLERHLEGGVELDARLSEPLLLSLFDPGSPGHDGAVLIREDRIERFAVHLPLSDDRHVLGGAGTRHAAALGLAQACDSLVVVVSEERGTVSVARDGELHLLSGPDELPSELRRFVEDTSPAPPGALRAAAERWPEAIVAGACAVGLWFVLIAGNSLVQVRHPAALVVDNVPEGFQVEAVDPPEVTVVVEGTRRRLYLADLTGVRVHVDALLVQLGRRTFTITSDQVAHPPGVRILDVEPGRVRLSVKEVEGDS